MSNTIYLRNSTRVYLIMNAKGEYYGPGGWLEDAKQARPFSPDDAGEMLKVFPGSAAVAAIVRGDSDRRSGAERRGERPTSEVPELEGAVAWG